MLEVQCPRCNTVFSGDNVYTYIINICKVCSGGYKLVGQRIIKVLERPPPKDVVAKEINEN